MINKEIITPDKFAMMMVKKDGIEATYEGDPLPDALKLYLFGKYCLNIVLEQIVQLDEEKIRGIYTSLDRPDPVCGDWWRPKVIEYLVGQHTRCYLLESVSDAITHAQNLKSDIRQKTHLDDSGDWAQKIFIIL